jgi:hypothetical protein
MEESRTGDRLASPNGLVIEWGSNAIVFAHATTLVEKVTPGAPLSARHHHQPTKSDRHSPHRRITVPNAQA